MTKIILHCPVDDIAKLPALVEEWIARKVALIAVVGAESETVHDLIDDIVIGRSDKENCIIATTWHNDEPIEDVVELAKTYGKHGPIEHVKV